MVPGRLFSTAEVVWEASAIVFVVFVPVCACLCVRTEKRNNGLSHYGEEVKKYTVEHFAGKTE